MLVAVKYFLTLYAIILCHPLVSSWKGLWLVAGEGLELQKYRTCAGHLDAIFLMTGIECSCKCLTSRLFLKSCLASAARWELLCSLCNVQSFLLNLPFFNQLKGWGIAQYHTRTRTHTHTHTHTHNLK